MAVAKDPGWLLGCAMPLLGYLGRLARHVAMRLLCTRGGCY